MTASTDETHRYLFVYGSLLPGEMHHDLLSAAECLGPARTRPGYRLVDLGIYAALIATGDRVVEGELYRVDLETRRHIDTIKEVPRLFQRSVLTLEDGREVECYLMREDQVRGRRRLRGSSWKTRFSSPALR